MKRILFILSFVCVVFQANSQIIDSTHFEFTTCNNSTYNYEGYVKIFSNIPSPSLWYDWQRDSSATWVTDTAWFAVDSMGFDEIGNYRVIVTNFFDTTIFSYVVDTLKSSRAGQVNISCNGDSTGLLKFIINGGVPFDPDSLPNSGDEYYDYQWYKDGSLYHSGQDTTMFIDSLFNGVHKSVPYSLKITDSKGCILEYLGKIDTFTSVTTGADSLVIDTIFMFQPDSFKIDILKIDSVGCRGENTAKSPGSDSSTKLNVVPTSACSSASLGRSIPFNLYTIWGKPEQSIPKGVLPPHKYGEFRYIIAFSINIPFSCFTLVVKPSNV